ncbi:MAG: efflux RND transporter periplasmic adaptor subunit [Planctomycetota bacterium]
MSVAVLRLVVRGAIALVLLGVASAIAFALYSSRPEPTRRDEPDLARLVTYIEATPTPIARVWDGYGTLEAKRVSNLSAELSGRIVERDARVEAGNRVLAGDVLVRIEATEYEQRLENIRESIRAWTAQLENLSVERASIGDSLALANDAVSITRTEIARLENAVARSGASQIELDRLRKELTAVERTARDLRRQLDLLPEREAELRSRISAEEANARVAELNVERTEIRAPFDGVIESVSVELGERVSPGQMVARIVDLSTLEAPIRIPASAGEDVTIGTRAVLSVASADGLNASRGVEARVARVSPVADPQTRTIEVFLEVEQNASLDTEELLRPGRFVTARFESARAIERIPVPRGSVRADRVFLINDEGRIEVRSVRVLHHAERVLESIHPRETQWAVLADGLARGQRVAVSNLDELSPNLTVRPLSVFEAQSRDVEPSIVPAISGAATTGGDS